jgi:hypothetical protein
LDALLLTLFQRGNFKMKKLLFAVAAFALLATAIPAEAGNCTTTCNRTYNGAVKPAIRGVTRDLEKGGPVIGAASQGRISQRKTPFSRAGFFRL